MFTIPKNKLLFSFLVSSSSFCTLMGYEFVRSATNTIFKNTYGTRYLPLAMMLTPIILVLFLYLYNYSLSKFGPKKTLSLTILNSGLIIFIFFIGISCKIKFCAFGLFLFRECYVVLIIEQYWSFLNSALKKNEAKLLNGPIAGWSCVGATLGGLSVGYLAQPLGTNFMLVFAGVLCVPAALLGSMGYKLMGDLPSNAKNNFKSNHLGLNNIIENPVLIRIFCLVIVTQIVSAALVINFQTILQESFNNSDAQTAFSGKFFALLNLSSSFLQFVVAPLLLKICSLRIIHMIIPCVHICSALYMLKSFSLYGVAAGYLLFKSFDYSIFRAAKEILYIPLSFDARFRAKEFIDGFGYRFGKGGASLVFSFLNLGAQSYTLIILIFSSIWVIVSANLERKKTVLHKFNLRTNYLKNMRK